MIRIENKLIKDRLIRDIRKPFEHEEENYYKTVRLGNFWSNSYILSNGNRNKTLSMEEYP